MRVLVNGAAGKMGREVLKAVHNDVELTLVGGVDPTHGGKDVSEFIGSQPLHIKLYSSLQEGIDATKHQQSSLKMPKQCYLKVFML